MANQEQQDATFSEVPTVSPIADEPQDIIQTNGVAAAPAPDMGDTYTNGLLSQDPTIMQAITPISADEIALYDRQIRLWGVQAQEKIRQANILLIGLKALGNEIAKNLVLAGVGVLTILDHEVVTEDDFSAQFFVSGEHLGQNRAEAALPQIQRLNSRVKLFSDTEAAVTKLPTYFSSFDITIATCLPLQTLNTINSICRISNRKFYAADTQGLYGYVFADLIMHDFVIEKDQGNKASKPGDIESPTRNVLSVSTRRENGKVIEIVTKREAYSPLLLVNSSPLSEAITMNRRSRTRVTPLLSCLRALFDFQTNTNGRLPSHSRADLELFTKLANEKHVELQLPMETLRADFLRSFLQNLGSEVSPVAAYLGGALAQDVINVLGQREQPIQNLLLFDGEDIQGAVYSMHPIFDSSMFSETAIGMTDGAVDMMNGTAIHV